MSEQYISPANMRSIAQAMEKDKSALMSAVQAIIEGTPIGESSLDDKIVATWEGVTFTERQLRDDRMTYLGQVLRRHRYGGGWVPLDQDKANITMPFVAETAYVGPSAMVYGDAQVHDDARVYGNARVYGSTMVYGDALVYGDARVYGNARVYGSARVYGNARVYGSARVFGGARVYGDARVSTAQVGHLTKLSGSDQVDKGYRGDSGDNNLMRVEDRTYRLKGIELDGHGRYIV